MPLVLYDRVSVYKSFIDIVNVIEDHEIVACLHEFPIAYVRKKIRLHHSDYHWQVSRTFTTLFISASVMFGKIGRQMTRSDMSFATGVSSGDAYRL